MADRTLRITLDEQACGVALEPRRAAGPALHPAAYKALATDGPAGSRTRIVTCTVAEARALLDHFSGLAHTLAGLGDPDAGVCATARDTIRRALVAAGM